MSAALSLRHAPRLTAPRRCAPALKQRHPPVIAMPATASPPQAPGAGITTNNATAASATPASAPFPPPASLAFLGCGIMGVPMVKRLLGAGFRVTVWNRTPGTPGVADLVAAGAVAAASPAEALASADVTFAMLADPAAARAVVADALAGAAGKGGPWGYVDVSTVDAGTAATVGDAVTAAGGSFLEAPVSGSKGPAETGQLIFLAAGDPGLYAAVSPALDAMGKAKFLLAETPGAGANMKLAVNALMGTMAVALGEALAVSEAAGLDPAQLVEVVGLGACAAPMFALKGPGMAAAAPRTFTPPAFPLKHEAKDMRLFSALCQEVGVAAPLMAGAAGAVFEAAEAKGLGDCDFVAVRELC